MKLNIKQMAKKAGVSVATISRAMNEETRKKVSPETLIRIDKLIQKYKYMPNLAAKNLRKTSTKMIGMVFPYVHNIFYSSYYTNILAGVANYLIGTEYQFKLILLKEMENKRSHYDFKAGEGVDGLILTQWFRFFSEEFMAKEINVPCVVINDFDKNVKAQFVCGDHFKGGQIAAKYLYSLGHHNVGIITGPSWSRDSRERLNGFRSYLQEIGYSLASEFVAQGDYDNNAKTHKAVDELLNKIPKITGIFCCNDNMAFAAIHRLKELGVSCPEDISVVGYDDDFRAATFDPPLTTIRMPMYDLAVKAASSLIEYLRRAPLNKLLTEEILIPTYLVERSSARCITPS